MSYTKLVRMPVELRERIDAEMARNGGSYKEKGHISANALCVKAIEFFLDSLSIHMDNESNSEAPGGRGCLWQGEGFNGCAEPAIAGTDRCAEHIKQSIQNAA